MGKGKKHQNDQSLAELEPYLSADEGESKQTEKLPIEELEKAEMAKAVLLDNLPVTTADKVSTSFVFPMEANIRRVGGKVALKVGRDAQAVRR